MFLRTFIRLASVASVAAFYPLVHAQSNSGEDLVPSDLSTGFESDSIQLQVSYTGTATDGFADGTIFNKQQTSKAPTFALGDASGVNTAISFAIMMVDTTSLTGRTLHFLQTGFQATEDETGIASNTNPSFPYRGPGTMGETGSRQYTFLMFQTPSSGFNVQSVPIDGKNFDIGKWQSDNGLQAALAGLTMKVDSDAGSGSSSKKPATTATNAQDTTTPSAFVTTSDSTVNVYTTAKRSNTSTSRPSASGTSISIGSSTTTPPSTTKASSETRTMVTTTGTTSRTANGASSSTRPADTTKPAGSTNGTNPNGANAMYGGEGYRMRTMAAGLLVAALAFMSL